MLYILLSEKAMAPHSSALAWKIPWMEEPGRLQSMGSLRVGHDWVTYTFTFHFHALEEEMATHSSTLAWRISGTAEPGGLLSMGWHRARHDWSDLAAAAAGSLSWWCSCFPSIFLFIYSGIILSSWVGSSVSWILFLLWWFTPLFW